MQLLVQYIDLKTSAVDQIRNNNSTQTPFEILYNNEIMKKNSRVSTRHTKTMKSLLFFFYDNFFLSYFFWKQNFPKNNYKKQLSPKSDQTVK